MNLQILSFTWSLIGFISMLLMAWAGTLSLILALRWSGGDETVKGVEIERRALPVLLSSVIVLGIRLINWPLFYGVLQSLVPDISGAMCIFGVTQVERILTGISELLKPVSFFLAGAWLLMHRLDLKTRTSPLMGRKLLFLSLVAVVLIAESFLDLTLMFRITSGGVVSCCTTVFDIPERPTRVISQWLLGTRYQSLLGFGTYLSNLLLIFLLAVYLRRMRPSHPARTRRPPSGIVFLYAIGNAVLFLLAQIENHGPKIMGLPSHHCPYCLWQYVPGTILIYMLFVLGTSATGWAFLLDLAGRTEETMETLYAYLRRLYGLSIGCLGLSTALDTILLVAA